MRAIILVFVAFGLAQFLCAGEADFWQNDCKNDCTNSYLPKKQKPSLKAKDKAMFKGIYGNYEATDRIEGKM